MSDVFKKLAALRAQYADDPSAIEQIESEQERVAALLRRKDLVEKPEVQELLALCRKDIVFARKRLGTERKLSEEARNELWFLIESRQWVLQMLARDYDAELGQIEHELEAELSR